MGEVDRAQSNIDWIQEHCRIPEGRDVGKPVRLREWQKDIIRGIYGGGVRRVIISFGRKNAKTTLSAFLCLLHLAGPEAKPNSQLYSAAQSREQAAVLFGLAAKIVRMSPTLKPFVTPIDSSKQLRCAEIGTLYRALSADASTAFGLSPVFVVHDELGQVKGPRSQLYEALETASAAHEQPLSIVISTQAPDDSDLLSLLIDDAKRSPSSRTRLFLWTADRDADPFCEETIRQANPAFGDFQNADEVLAMADDAERMPPREAEYRNLILNQRVNLTSPFVSPSVWKANAGEPEPFGDRPVYGGLDLAQRNDMSALVWIADGDVEPHFWLPDHELGLKAKRDRVEYDIWADEGHLHTSPGTSISYRDIAEEIVRARAKWNVRSIAVDPYNFEALVSVLVEMDMAPGDIEALFHKVPQTYGAMSPCIGELQAQLMDGNIRHGGHPVLEWNARNAVVVRGRVTDQMLLAKPKGSDHQRIDGMVALAMAVGRRAMMLEEAKPEPEYRMVFVG